MAASIWVKVKGGKTTLELSTANVRNVAALIEMVKEKAKPRLDNVPFDHLQLYQSEETTAEALKPGKPVADIDGGRDDDHPLYLDYPDVPVTKWLKDGCFTMLGTCSGNMAVICRCLVLFLSVAVYVVITVDCYDDGDVPAFRALLATFVLTGADLLPKICHEAHEDIIEWCFALFLLAFGLLALHRRFFSEDVCMGIITGAAANLYKKLALLLICTAEFRQASLRSLERFFPTLMRPATSNAASAPLLPGPSHTG